MGSGDLTQRAKRVEAGGCEVVRRERGVKKVVGVMGQGVKSEGKAMWLKRVRAEMWKDNERRGGGGGVKKKKRKQKQKL